ncbi:MAG: DNA polymerase III subunit epsilon [Firmicutes bacterium]|nr:DNA polymerase III subunit epsilon [Bacillota bacterium]
MNTNLIRLTEDINPAWGKAAFIDVETTGLNPAHEEIIEFAISLFAFNQESGKILGIIDEYNGLREPSCPISRGAFMVHQINKEAVKGMILDRAKIEDLISQADFLIAHNARFDKNFVSKLFPMALTKPWYCSMNGIKWYQKGYSSKALQKLLAAHRIKVEEAHRAGADVRGCLLLLSQVNEEGITYLLELIKGYQKKQDNRVV